MKLISPNYICVREADVDATSLGRVAVPDTAHDGQLRFATVTQALEGTLIQGATPLQRGDQVVLATGEAAAEDGGERIVRTDDVLAFWRPTSGRIGIEPVGDRVLVETGFFFSDAGEYGVKGAALPQSRRAAGIAVEGRLGEHATLAAVSRGVAVARGVDFYTHLLRGVGNPCQIAYEDSSSAQLRTSREKSRAGCITEQLVLSLGDRVFILTPVRWVFSISHSPRPDAAEPAVLES